MSFKVEMNFIYGWDDADWHESDDKTGEETPLRFESREEAQAEIDEFIKTTQEAAEKGYMDEAYNPEDYRIVEDLDSK